MKIRMERILIILFSLLGISATFMPWLHYPKGDAVIHGYLADGIITGFLFFLLLIYSVVTFRKERLKIIPAAIFGLLAGLMAYMSYSTIQEIEAEKLSFSSDDPWIASATAGFHQGVGIYVFGLAGLGILLTIGVILLLQSLDKKKNALKSEQKTKSPIGTIAYAAIILLLVSLAGFFFMKPQLGLNKPGKQQMEQLFSEDIREMGEALAKADYERFVGYNLPMFIQNYGGKDKLIDMMQQILAEYEAGGVQIRGSEFKDILDIRNSGSNIQALLASEFRLRMDGRDSVINQKMLAVSEDNGNSWYYINLDGMTRDKLKGFYPQLIETIEF